MISRGDPKTGRFYDAYINASNYAVGVFMAGAGYSLNGTEILANRMLSYSQAIMGH